MSLTKFNKNKTVSIIGLTKAQYDALRKVVYSATECFDEENKEGEYYSNENFLCILTKEEKEGLEEINI